MAATPPAGDDAASAAASPNVLLVDAEGGLHDESSLHHSQEPQSDEAKAEAGGDPFLLSVNEPPALADILQHVEGGGALGEQSDEGGVREESPPEQFAEAEKAAAAVPAGGADAAADVEVPTTNPAESEQKYATQNLLILAGILLCIGLAIGIPVGLAAGRSNGTSQDKVDVAENNLPGEEGSATNNDETNGPGDSEPLPGGEGLLIDDLIRPRPTARPSDAPSNYPSSEPSSRPSSQPSSQPSSTPSSQPSSRETIDLLDASSKPSSQTTSRPSQSLSDRPSNRPSARPSVPVTSMAISWSRQSASPTAQPSTQQQTTLADAFLADRESPTPAPSGPGCYPTYAPGTDYGAGDWVSQSISETATIECTNTIMDPDPFCVNGEKTETVEAVYNFQCREGATAVWCANLGYRPGGIYGDIGWRKEEEPCE